MTRDFWIIAMWIGILVAGLSAGYGESVIKSEDTLRAKRKALWCMIIAAAAMVFNGIAIWNLD